MDYPHPAWVEDPLTGEVLWCNVKAAELGPVPYDPPPGQRLVRLPLPPIHAHGSLVTLEPTGAAPSSPRRRDWRNLVFEGIARQQSLPTLFGYLTQAVEELVPGAKPVFFELVNGALGTHTLDTGRGSFVASLDGLSAGGPDEPVAPWWHLRNRTARLAEDPLWRPYLAAALLEGFSTCWSDLLVTVAGEVVGTLTIFLPPLVQLPEAFADQVAEITELAGLTLEQNHLLTELTFLAQRDPLTGLLNRSQLSRLVTQRLTQDDEISAIIWLDLDGFEQVNSMLGCTVGDEILREAARRLRSLLRSVDSLARAESDEFAVMLSAITSETEALHVATRIQEVLKHPFEIFGHSIMAGASIGVAMATPHVDDAASLLRKARLALDAARHSGRGSIAVFEPQMLVRSSEHMEVVRLLHLAKARGELSLHYQPQFDLRTGALAGCEALMRWRQPDVGMVSPATFIPVAEETGLISDFGEWALQEACRQGREWVDLGFPLRIGVNVSPHQIRTTAFVLAVERVLAATGFPAHLLELEITESAILSDIGATIQHMRQLQERGICFALDDFGTGQSSLAWLRDLPVDRIKVDRRFLRELAEGERTPILDTIVHLAHELALSVIIEGIETEQQEATVASLGCDEMQGFLRGRPIPPHEFRRLYLHG